MDVTGNRRCFGQRGIDLLPVDVGGLRQNGNGEGRR